MKFLVLILSIVIIIYIYKQWNSIEPFENTCIYPLNSIIHIPISNAKIGENGSIIISDNDGNNKFIDIIGNVFEKKGQLKDGVIEQLNSFLKDPFDNNEFLNKKNCKYLK